MQHVELGAAAPGRVSGEGVMFGCHLHASFARQSTEPLQGCDSLWIKFGNCDAGGDEIREGLPPEGGKASAGGQAE